jgi:hypothetical protein
LSAFAVLIIERVEQFGSPPHSMRESAMQNDTETPETNPNKGRWTATAAGYAFVLAMGAMAMWMAPSPASDAAHQSSAAATAPFTAFAGSGSGRVVLGQPEGKQLADGSAPTGKSTRLTTHN